MRMSRVTLVNCDILGVPEKGWWVVPWEPSGVQKSVRHFGSSGLHGLSPALRIPWEGPWTATRALPPLHASLGMHGAVTGAGDTRNTVTGAGDT